MTNTENKIKQLPNKEEAYKYGYKKGFGKCLGLCIGWVRKEFTRTEEQMLKQFVLRKKCPKCNRPMALVDGQWICFAPYQECGIMQDEMCRV